MEVEMQLDDDLFFAELSKRITVLITDDDDADFVVAAAAAAAAVQFPDAMHLPPVSLPFPFHLLLACSCHFSLPRAATCMDFVS
jgi:hypothetical protein